MRSEPGTPGAYPDSWYAASTTPLAAQPALEGRIDCDVCILGAGYTGLSAALELAEAGYRVVLLEAQRIGWGASGRNGGQAIVGFGCGEEKLEALVGLDAARRMFDLSRGKAWPGCTHGWPDTASRRTGAPATPPCR
ncbi:glycine/D-amino acid oxidase-like deaminating enzyme [Pseudoxanthomonas winnipegensis]|nr:glycine/D-amino acid oxidase-like deaminating enzyme [Pseudoxanthomonas winnipegensis]